MMRERRFNDNYTFYLFSKDYLSFKPMLESGWFLYLTGSVQNRWNSEELEFRIHNIEHLSEIREKMTKALELRMRLKDVNEVIVEEIERLAIANPGKCSLKLFVTGAHEDRVIQLEMLSRTYSIDLNDKLMTELKQHDEIEYTVLSN